MDLAENVYYSLIGELVEPTPGVPNAFALGSSCEKMYGEMLAAYERARQRMGIIDEDEDIEKIIDSLLMIQRILCIEMFRLGASMKEGKVPPCTLDADVL